nr:zinc finger, CCHC-type [Tanacetum cinerariifolium]
MVAAALKHMDSKFTKLEKFEGVDFRRWQKKMHFLLSSMCVVYVLTTPIHEDGENATVEQLRKRAKWDNDDYVCKGLILNENESSKNHLRIKESIRVQDSDKPKGNNVVGPLVVNIMEHNNSSRKPVHLKKDYKGEKVSNKANGSGTNGLVDGSTNSLKG